MEFNLNDRQQKENISKEEFVSLKNQVAEIKDLLMSQQQTSPPSWLQISEYNSGANQMMNDLQQPSPGQLTMSHLI